jgi:hypothetical protein
MKLHIFIFLVLLATCGVVVATFLTPQAPFEEVVLDDGSTRLVGRATGIAHPDFPTMRQGGPGAERHAVTLWLGWAFVLLNIAFFGGFLAMGVTRNGSLGPMRMPIVAGSLVLAAIFTWLVFSYRSYLTAETPTLVFGFPVPTALMIYAVWLFPGFFMLVYYRFFDSWFFTADDRKRVDELVAAQREAE